MPMSARIGDISVGICCWHGLPPWVPWVGVCVTGASTVQDEASSSTRITDIFIGCHPQLAITGAPHVIDESLMSSRVGDITVGCTIGTIVTGAPTVIDE